MIRAEAVAIAMHSLDKKDKVILRGLMAGRTDRISCARLGISRERVRQRLNKALWKLRCNRNLANAIGVEPGQLPDRPEGGPWPNFPGKPPAAPIAA
jgi:DNA-binding CsgD family transcriptional regulator